MLDAAHGETESPAVCAQRSQLARKEAQESRIAAVRRIRRGRPHIAVGADHVEITRLTVAVARSRRWKQSLRRMTERLLNE